MSEVVVDTNVWVMADEVVAEAETDEEKLCIKSCEQWLQDFVNGDDRLVLDDYVTWQIMTEYRNNVRGGGIAESILNRLSSIIFHRLVLKEIDLDPDMIAIVPSPLDQIHKNDRKFVAVAIRCEPFATICHATDRGWVDNQRLLEEYGLTIHGLCPELAESNRSSD